MKDIAMANSMRGRIHPGASVEGSDGPLGRVVRVERDVIEVFAPQSQHTLRIPLDQIRGVRADGAVELAATRAEVEPLAQLAADAEGQTSSPVGTLELREEQLVARKELEEAGRIRIHKAVEDIPRRLEVDAYYEEVEVEHVPIGRVVKEREPARIQDDVCVVPIYEEQLVVVKRLVLKEEIHVRLQGATEKHLFEDIVRRERLVIDDPDQTGRVREHYPTDRSEGERVAGDTVPSEEEAGPEAGGLLEKLGRKVLE